MSSNIFRKIIISMAALCLAAEGADTRWSLDLSGHRWQMEGIRPGQGEKEGFHLHFGTRLNLE